MKYRIYQGVQLSKNQTDLVDFIETGSNNFWDCYYRWKFRNKRVGKPTLQIASWFNRRLKQIHAKGILKEIPYVYSDGQNIFIWNNPGINASKANFECVTLHDAEMELKSEVNKIL